jgi:F-type H+-transporting ATPase subunit delta
MMRSASRRAIEALRTKQQDTIGTRTSGPQLTELADELYSIAGVLVAQPRLRRTLGDAATSPEGRADLLERLVSGKVGKQALDIAKAAVSERWSSAWDLTDALESAGDDALFAAAEKGNSLDEVEDELFRLERILEAEGEVTGLLDEYTVDAARRTALLDSLVKDKVSPITLALLHHAIASQRKRSILLAVDDLLEQATARQERSVARVISAVPMSDAQQERLAARLSAIYGRAISVRTALDPAIWGGLVVRVGDEVIDGSVTTRFAEVRAALAG